MSGMFYIICYDTPSNKRRRKLHKLLKNYAVTVQKSVFETILDGPRFEEMMKKIAKLGDEAVDSIRVYRMTREAQKQMTVIGLPGILEDPDHILVQTGTVLPEHYQTIAVMDEDVDQELPEWL